MAEALRVWRHTDPANIARRTVEALPSGSVLCTGYGSRGVDPKLRRIAELVREKFPTVAVSYIIRQDGERMWHYSLGAPQMVWHYPRQEPEVELIDPLD
jgi:hypothetical protein